MTAEVSLTIKGTLSGSGDLGTPKFSITPISELLAFADGTANVGSTDLMFADTRTLAASATENIDLAGALSNAFGATITAAELVLLFIKAHEDNTNAVNVTRPASNGVPIYLAAGDGRALLPGEYELIVSQAGIAVTASTGDLITITNGAGDTSVTYDILVLARSVAA